MTALCSMSSDGMLPAVFGRVSQRFRTPTFTTVVCGIAGAIVAGLVPITVLGQLVSIGTLMAFLIVCGGVLILRRTNPGMERPFRVPFSPVFPIIGVGLCIYLMTKLPGETWIRFVVWLLVGFIIYFTYSRTHSRLRTGDAPPPETELPPGESL